MTMVDLKVVVVGVSSWLISMLSLLTLLHLVFLVSVLQRSRQHLHSEGKHVRQCESWTVLVLRLYLLVPGAGIKGHNCSGEQPVFFLPPCDLSFWEGERGCPKSGGEPPEREGGGKGGGGLLSYWGILSRLGGGKGVTGKTVACNPGVLPPLIPRPTSPQQSMHETDIRSEEVSWKSPGAICVELKHSQLSVTPATGMEGTEVSMEKRRSKKKKKKN